MNPETLKQALNECRQRQARNAEEEKRRLKEASLRCSAIGEAVARRQQAILDSVRCLLDGQRAGAIPQTTRAYNEQIARLLGENGFRQDYLDPVYTCPACRDSGYRGSTKKTLCGCVVQRCQEIESGPHTNESFETYDDQVFAKEPLAGSDVSQQAYMRAVRARCEEYASTLPASATLNLLLYGGSGLGKTFLLRAIARRAAQRGIATLALTANQLLNRIRRSYFAREQEMDDGLETIPLLLIDDLGTEPMWENITVEQLFSLLDARLTARRHTVLSTNLSLTELQARYTERITSRLLDERNTQALHFLGQDIRRRAK